MIRLISNERGDTALVEAYRTLRSIYNMYVINKNVSLSVLQPLLAAKALLK